MSPRVLSLANRDKKLELEYIGTTMCSVKMKPIIAIVYIT
jgi:hypothetical protein